jgi:hypothetical protein
MTQHATSALRREVLDKTLIAARSHLPWATTQCARPNGGTIYRVDDGDARQHHPRSATRLRSGNTEGRTLLRRRCLLSMSQMLLVTVCSVAGAQTSPWSHLSLTGGPTLDASSYIYDPVSNRMVVYGGADSQAGCFTTIGDTWLITHANGMGGTPLWKEVSAAGTHPSARNRASAVYDQPHNRMIVFGGASCGGVAPELFNDVWVLFERQCRGRGSGLDPTEPARSASRGSRGTFGAIRSERQHNDDFRWLQ